MVPHCVGLPAEYCVVTSPASNYPADCSHCGGSGIQTLHPEFPGITCPTCNGSGKEPPHRVQLSRKKGWRMPPNTVKVDRTTKWGNPYQASSDGDGNPAYLVHLFCGYMARSEQAQLRDEARRDLRGKNLACWCPLDQPCHADVLLELANGR